MIAQIAYLRKKKKMALPSKNKKDICTFTIDYIHISRRKHTLTHAHGGGEYELLALNIQLRTKST